MGIREETSNARMEDTHKFAELYSQLSHNKQAVIIAFMKGMSVQSAIDEKLRSQIDYVDFVNVDK